MCVDPTWLLRYWPPGEKAKEVSWPEAALKYWKQPLGLSKLVDPSHLIWVIHNPHLKGDSTPSEVTMPNSTRACLIKIREIISLENTQLHNDVIEMKELKKMDIKWTLNGHEVVMIKIWNGNKMDYIVLTQLLEGRSRCKNVGRCWGRKTLARPEAKYGPAQ